MSDNMKMRKKLYYTHTLHNHKVVYMSETKCPRRLESCIIIMLYNHRYTSKKDFFECSLQTIKKAFKICHKSMIYMNQSGGAKISYEKNLFFIKNIIERNNKKILSIKSKIKTLDNKLLKK